VCFRHSSERIAWLIFDIISPHQKSNPRDEIAQPPQERRSVPEAHFGEAQLNYFIIFIFQ
jgi:hypothetical protein